MNIYQSNIQKYKTTIFKLAKVLNRLSILRLVVFVFSAIIIIILANERLVTLIWLAVPLCVLGFGLLIKRHNQVVYLKRHTTFLKEINEFEVFKLENKLSDFPTGQTFINRDHPYVSDLDIFGTHSLFQLLNRTTTESGNLCLAEWLSESASKDVILERQQAIKELTPKLDWRQHFQALGMHFKNSKSDYNKLLTWIEKPVKLLPNQSKYLIVCIGLSLLSTLALFYYIIHAYSTDSFPYIIPLIVILSVNFFGLRREKPVA